MNRRRVVLVKPPGVSHFDFGAFSLAVLAAAIRDIADPVIIDLTNRKADEAGKMIWSLGPDIVGITVMGLDSVRAAQRFLRLLTSGSAMPTIPIVVGGHGVIGQENRFLKAGATATVRGEGELTFRSIIEQGVEPGAPGLTCLMNDGPVAGPPQILIRPLDRLPFPARDIMPMPRDGIHLMETSRGCPHRCTFCETTRFFGSQWRAFSPKRVAGEAVGLVETYGAWTILLADDNFAVNSSRVLEICERLERGALPAAFFASARADDLVRHPKVIPAMARARILRVTVGVETLDSQTMGVTGKLIPPDIYREAFSRLRACGIFSIASFITGLPGQQEEIGDVVERAVQAGPDAAVFVPFLPMPGTPLADGRTHFAASTTDQVNAVMMTAAFYRHAKVRQQLAEAEAAGGLRAMMARSTLRNAAQREVEATGRRSRQRP